MPTRQGVRAKRPQKGFTATYIKGLPAGTREKDPAQRGLYIDVTARADGQLTRTWLHRFGFGGTADTNHVVGHFPATSLERARHIVQEQREQLSQGIDPRRARPRRTTRPAPLPLSSAISPENQHSVDYLVSEFVERYLRKEMKRPEYGEWALGKHVLPSWRGRDARTIEPAEVIDLLDGIAATAPVMSNRVATLLTKLFKFGIHRKIVTASPVMLLFRPGGKEHARERLLEDAELQVFLKDPIGATRFPRLSHVITLLLLTGVRRGELAAAKWSQVDFTEKVWTIPGQNTKTGAALLVPLTDAAVTEFQQLKKLAGKSVWVVPGKDAKTPVEPRLLTRGLAKCLARFKAAGIKPFVLHDCRRTLRTGLARLGVDDGIAERVLNHNQDGVAGVYNVHKYLPEKRAALEMWSTHLKALRDK